MLSEAFCGADALWWGRSQKFSAESADFATTRSLGLPSFRDYDVRSTVDIYKSEETESGKVTQYLQLHVALHQLSKIFRGRQRHFPGDGGGWVQLHIFG